MHLSPPPPPVASAAVRSKAVVLLLLLPLWESVIVLCFVVRYLMSILVLQSSWWGRESWLLCLICLPGVSWWLSGSSSRCHGVVHTHLLILPPPSNLTDNYSYKPWFAMSSDYLIYGPFLWFIIVCVNLIRLFLCGNALNTLGDLHVS